MSKTNISWTDFVANPFPGCKKVNEGCRSCYAEKMAKRLKAIGHAAYRDVVDDDGHWTGKVGRNLDVMKVMGTGKKIFVNSMGDLAYEEVSFSDFVNVIGHIMLQPWHTFQVLTKRPDEMAKRIQRIINDVTAARYLDPLMFMVDSVTNDFTEAEFVRANQWYKTNTDQSDRGICDLPVKWPLRNLWMGATCENQQEYDNRTMQIVECRAALHFLSLEPLLSSIQLTWPHAVWTSSNFFLERESLEIDWIIVGCETIGSRPGRECKLDWIKSIVDQCHNADIPVFVKQVSHEGKVIHDSVQIADLLGTTVEQIRQWPKGGI